ncbi:MAG: T9SS type A sorting domain-containing protein [Bacteroidia bacterium]|nr:T9SS type A sorting domain-containing protein [Bacteroidia bacterium]
MGHKYIKAILFFLLVVMSSVHGVFQKFYSYGSARAHSRIVLETSNNGFVIAGYEWTTISSPHSIFLMRIDALGDTMWRRTYGDSLTSCAAMVITSDSGYLIIGDGNSDIHLIKTDSLGSILWTKNYGGPINESSYDVKQCDDGGYIILGTTLGIPQIYMNTLLIRTDSIGNILWSKIYGSSHIVEGFSVIQTDDGGFLIGGLAHRVDTDRDILIIKTNAIGDTLWTRVYGGLGNDDAHSIFKSSDGNYVVGGACASFSNAESFLLMKIDTIGNVIWAKVYLSGQFDHAYSAIPTFDFGIAIVGRSHFKSLIIKTQSNGDTMWSQLYEYPFLSSFDNISECSDRGFVITGLASPYAYVLKTDRYGDSGCSLGGASITVLSPTMPVNPHTFYISNPAIVSTSTSISVSNSNSVGTDICLLSNFSDYKLKENLFLLSPNPVRNELKVKLSSNFKNVIIQIFNLRGHKIYEKAFENFETGSISTIEFPSGIYFCRITDGIKNGIEKIVVMHE